ncbi:MAG TPA: N-acetyl-gamma-glutamyl-phosphate reductase [Gemmatimonadales bacterium]
MKVAVIGGAGYVGGELLRLIQGHPEVSEWVATSRSQAGKPVSDLHPALAAVTEARFAADAPAEAARGRDVVFLCLEHGESTRIVGEVLGARPGLVVDLAADFRIRDPELHARYYGAPPESAFARRFTYALADVLGAELRGKTALAAPGCYATVAQLALYPLRGLAFAAPPVLFAVTGSSGAGAKPKATTHHPARAHNLFAYSLFGHRHEGEILEQWRHWVGQPGAQARLLTHSGPFVRGIHLSLYAVLADAAVLPLGGAEGLLLAAYQDRPFVRVVKEPPQLTHVVGTNLAILHGAESDDGREIQVLAVIDNLVKGAGGQALQAVNLALGLSETAGLVSPAAFPI